MGCRKLSYYENATLLKAVRGGQPDTLQKEQLDYYVFGAVLPGRDYNSASSRYGFNGQMKVPEISPNEYTAEFWEYNADIGMRENIDPKGNAYTSPYVAFNDNPILYSDALGDTSIYFNNAGKTIGTINHGNGLTAIEVPNDKVVFVSASVNAINGNSKLSEKAIEAADNNLQRSGTAYDINSFIGFYNKFRHSVLAKTVNGESTKDWKGIKLNGKSSVLYAEVQAKIGVVNGKVAYNNDETQSKGDFTNANPSDITDKPGGLSHIHLHNISQPTELTYTVPDAMGSGRTTVHQWAPSGPSPDDESYGAKNEAKNGTRTIMVDAKSVHLMNGNKDQDIILKR